MYFEKAVSGLNDPIRYIGTIVAVMFAYGILGQLPLTGVLFYKINQDPNIGMEDLNKFQSEMNFETFGLSNNLGFLLMIMIFVISMLVLMLCIKHLHKMPFVRLITPNRKIDWSKIMFGFGLWMILAAVLELFLYFRNPEVYSFDFKPVSFLFLVIICFTLLIFQTSFEELFFRGYLMPWLGSLIKNKWVPLIITSVLFGLVHGMNPEIEKYGFWTMEVYYVSAGLFLGLITILDDSLELALGVHAATNVFGASILSYEGSVLQTDTLFSASVINPITMIIVFYIAALIFIFVCWRKYKWPGFSRLTEPVGLSEAIDKVN